MQGRLTRHGAAVTAPGNPVQCDDRGCLEPQDSIVAQVVDLCGGRHSCRSSGDALHAKGLMTVIAAQSGVH